MLAPPCGSWGTAADRRGAIRSTIAPWGLTDRRLTAPQRARLALGNATMRSAIALLQTCSRHGVPCILEHPMNSRIWHVESIKRLEEQGEVRVLDQCQCGARWRKRTKFLCINIDSLDSECLNRRCQGAAGLCSRTGKHHLVLEGSAGGGLRWTSIAAAYPRALNRLLAKTLLAAWKAEQYNCSPPSLR
eukprot:11160928-Lingulodinium_polyedra.AAC.1